MGIQCNIPKFEQLSTLVDAAGGILSNLALGCRKFFSTRMEDCSSKGDCSDDNRAKNIRQQKVRFF